MTTSILSNITCPTCGKPVEWSDSFPFRPFCSKRCQLIDFGDWAEEKHRIPSESDPFSGELDDES